MAQRVLMPEPADRRLDPAAVREIMEMFSYARPPASGTEDAFVSRFLTPLGFKRDLYRNLVLEVPERDGSRSRVLFSSHVDTVSRKEGIQTLHFDGETLALSKRSKAEGFSCLGADDTAGVWIMVQMIRAKVPGVYVIHHAEESGCLGSGRLAENDPAFFRGIEIALAFDRAGTSDVITHQMGRRTASNGFAWSLVRQLKGTFEPSDAGVYTDTNEYADLVAECSNLSVGYYGQHSQRETQDVGFLIDLAASLIACDWSSLNVERKPGDGWDFPDWHGGGDWRGLDTQDWSDDRTRARHGDLMDLVEEYPAVAAELLMNLGISPDDFEEAIFELTGRVPDSAIPF